MIIRRLCLCGLTLVVLGCAVRPPAAPEGRSLLEPDVVSGPLPAAARPVGDTVSIVLVGDVMVGRGVAAIVASDPAGVFEGVRHHVAAADLAAGNLESPLTRRSHTARHPFALEADPSAAGALALAGFDVMAVANNHAGDAGPSSVLDTISALGEAGVAAVGGGADLTEAQSAHVVELNGISIGMLAFDATRAGLPATAAGPGIAHWVGGEVRRAVTGVRPDVDLLVVSVHGGVEHYPGIDPAMALLGRQLVAWGADVVWGHGSHVVQPIAVVGGVGSRPALVATSLGNFLFDQNGAGTQQGALLEVLAGRDGLLAYRLGQTDHSDGRARFGGWTLPDGDAVLLDHQWWNLVEPVSLVPASPGRPPERFTGGDVVDAALGDATGDGLVDVVVSHRRPYRMNGINLQFPEHRWEDRDGRSAHLGVYEPATLREIWVAGTLFRPIARLAVCEGSIALAFDSLNDPEIVATGGWVWDGFGFRVPAELPGPGRPGCSDVDGDGRLDPVIVDRSSMTGRNVPATGHR